MNYRIKLHRDVCNEIILHAQENVYVECGGYLIGKRKIEEDQITFLVMAIYKDASTGSPNRYLFSNNTRFELEKYCKQNLRNLTIIGNYHSHGQYDAIFSNEDHIMEENSPDLFCHIVYSPKTNEISGEVHVTKNQIEKAYITYYGEEQKLNSVPKKR